MTSLSYPSYQNAGEIRAAAILTTSYVTAVTWGEKAIDQARNMESSHLLLDIDFTKGSLTKLEIKVEYSNDGVNWFNGTTSSAVAGVVTVSDAVFTYTASTVSSLAVTLIKHPFVRVSAQGATTLTSSSLAISARFIS